MTQAPAPPPTDKPTAPVPRRYWWLKRLGGAAVIYLLLLLGVRFWWGHVAAARLEARLAQLRAQGEPVAPSDFVVTSVADEDNAASYLSKAAAALPRPSWQGLDLTDLDRRSCAENLAVLQTQFAANAQVFDLVRAARDKLDADWGIRLTSPAINVLLPFLSPQRALAKFLGGAALTCHLAGDDAAAVENLRDMLRIGERMDAAQPPVLITHLVAIAIEALATARVEDIAPNLQVAGSTVPPPATVTPAPRAEVQALISALLDDQLITDGWRHAFQGERAFQFDTVQCVVSRTLSGPGLAAIMQGVPPALTPLALAIEPAWELDALRLLDANMRMIKAGSAANWPTARAQWPRLEELPGSASAISRWMSRAMLPSLDRSLVSHFRAIVERRLAAVALAMRLYELDHGRRPDTLAALVPEYLPAIPLDPFDAGGGPLRYAPDAPTPVLYSVGNDGVDDHGAFCLRPSGNVDQEVKDKPFFLNGDRPLPPPPPAPAPPLPPTSTQAVPDDQQPVDAERKQQQEQPQ